MRNNLIKTVSTIYKNARPITMQAESVTSGEGLKPWTDIPTPPSLPAIGQLHHYLPGGMLHDRRAADRILYEKYGPIVRIEGTLGMPSQLYLFDPEASAEILRGENWNPIRPGFFSLRYYRNNKSNSDGPKGLITEDGEKWREFRNAVSPALLQPKTIKLYRNAISEVADDMIERLKSNRDSNKMLTKDLSNEMSLWALESIGVVALGRRLQCLDPALSPHSKEARLIKLLHQVFAHIEELDFKPNLSFWIKTPAFKRAMQVYAEQESLIQYFVKKTQDELKASNQTRSEDNKSVLEKLLDINEDYAVSMANDMLFAGVDSTSNSMMFALYQLATNPDKQEKLREEVMTVKNDDDKKYLKACIKETFRVMPVVPGNLRLTTKEYNLLGYKVPKNTMVIMFNQLMCGLESQYPRPQEFIPERWLDKTSPLSHASAHPFAHLPFGFGVRTCIGRRIVHQELETFLTKLMQNFQVEWVGPQPLKVITKTVNCVEPPYNFVFNDVKK